MAKANGSTETVGDQVDVSRSSGDEFSGGLTHSADTVHPDSSRYEPFDPSAIGGIAGTIGSTAPESQSEGEDSREEGNESQLDDSQTPESDVDAAELDDDAGSFDKAVIDRAVQLGLTEDQAKSFESPAELEAALQNMEIRQAQLHQPGAGQQGGQQAQGQQVFTPEQLAYQPKAKIDRDEMPEHASVHDDVVGLGQHVSAQVAQLANAIAAMQSQMSVSQQQAEENIISAAVSHLKSTPFEQFFSNPSTAQRNRELLKQQMGVLANAYRNVPNAAPKTPEELGRAAANMVWGDVVIAQARANARSEMRNGVNRRKGSRVNPPTSGARNRKAPSTPEEAQKEALDAAGDVLQLLNQGMR